MLGISAMVLKECFFPYLPACEISLPLTLTNPSESYREHTSLDRAVALAAPHQHKPIWLCHSPGWSQALGTLKMRREKKGLGKGMKSPLTFLPAERHSLLQRRPLTTCIKQPSTDFLSNQKYGSIPKEDTWVCMFSKAVCYPRTVCKLHHCTYHTCSFGELAWSLLLYQTQSVLTECLLGLKCQCYKHSHLILMTHKEWHRS